MFTLTVSGATEEAVLRGACSLRQTLLAAAKDLSGDKPEILGPAPAPVVKVNNRYRYRVLWIGRNDHATREVLAYYVRAFHQKKENRGMNLFVDCNGAD